MNILGLNRGDDIPFCDDSRRQLGEQGHRVTRDAAHFDSTVVRLTMDWCPSCRHLGPQRPSLRPPTGR
jgi:hypothetical protein